MSREPVRITVGGQSPYEVVIGEQLLAELTPMIGTNTSRVAVIHPRVMAPSGEAVRLELELSGYQALAIEVPDGEAAKASSVAAFCWSVLARNGFTRSDAIVGVGGGATTDLAGFVAATWLRGVRVIHLPTTLLGMVDAAIGGKTGINTDEGKNLVGAFHPPAGVLCDLGALHTLPQPDYVAGLAEVVKVGFTHDQSILDLIESNPEEASTVGGRHTSELIARAIRVKAQVVAADLVDIGEREFLNYGHTLAHAIERNERYTWRHGDAVSVGMVYAAHLARLAGLLTPDTARRHETLLASLGLPTSYRADAWPSLLETMRVDKKSRGDRLRFVVLEDLGRPTMLDGPDPALLVAAYEEVSG